MKSASYADTTGVLLRTVALLLAVVSGACAARSGGPSAPREAGSIPRPFPGAELPPATVDTAPPPVEAFGGLVRTALEFLGVPYRDGGSDPSGFDCSGFVQWVFGRHGLALPREVHDQYHVGRTIDLEDVREGDLLFFETVARGASHVGIALGRGRFVHAPSSRGVVRVEPYTASYWARRFVGARRVSENVEEGRRVENVDEVENVREVIRPRVFPGSIRSAR